MITLKFTEEEKEALNYERYHHPESRVQRKMEALWLKSQDESHQKIAQLYSSASQIGNFDPLIPDQNSPVKSQFVSPWSITGVTVNVVTKYVKQYKVGGIEKLKEINMYRPESRMKEHQQTIENYFREHPLATIKAAMSMIEKITGFKRSEKPVRKFLKRIG